MRDSDALKFQNNRGWNDKNCSQDPHCLDSGLRNKFVETRAASSLRKNVVVVVVVVVVVIGSDLQPFVKLFHQRLRPPGCFNPKMSNKLVRKMWRFFTTTSTTALRLEASLMVDDEGGVDTQEQHYRVK